MSDPQRTWAGVAFTDTVKVQTYEPFSQGGEAYLGSADIEVGFAGKKRVETPYDQDDLANAVTKVCSQGRTSVLIWRLTAGNIDL